MSTTPEPPGPGAECTPVRQCFSATPICKPRFVPRGSKATSLNRRHLLATLGVGLMAAGRSFATSPSGRARAPNLAQPPSGIPPQEPKVRRLTAGGEWIRTFGFPPAQQQPHLLDAEN